MSVSQNLGGNASPITTTINGKEYRFGLLTQKAKSAIERVVQDRARAELFRDKADLGDDEFRLAYGAYMDRVSGGAFAFGAAICRQFMTSSIGLETVVKILAGIPADEASMLVSRFTEEVSTIIGTVFTESFPSTRKETEALPGAGGASE